MADQKGLQDGWLKGWTQVQDYASQLVFLIGENKATILVFILLLTDIMQVWCDIVQVEGVCVCVCVCVCHTSPFHTGEDALSPQWWFANSPSMVIHTEPRISALKTNHCVIYIKGWHCVPWWWCWCVFKVYPWCPPCQSKATDSL